MGTWGSKAFQNDWALDWLGDLRKSEDFSLVRDALRRVVEHGGTKRHPPSMILRLLGRRSQIDWLKADVSSKAIAGAEIVAAWLGHPSSDLPDGVLPWLQKHAAPMQPEPDIVSLARKAVSIVKTNSELKDLWDESDASNWKNAIEDIERRLASSTSKGAASD